MQTDKHLTITVGYSWVYYSMTGGFKPVHGKTQYRGILSSDIIKEILLMLKPDSYTVYYK